jgi:hypothetical protein
MTLSGYYFLCPSTDWMCQDPLKNIQTNFDRPPNLAMYLREESLERTALKILTGQNIKFKITPFKHSEQ